MSKKKPYDVFAEIDKYSLIFRVVGLFTLKYSMDNFKISRKWIVWSVFALWPFIVFDTYTPIFKWAIAARKLYTYMTIIETLLVPLCLFLVWMMYFTKLDALNKSLRNIRVVDYYLFSIGEPVSPSKPSKVLIIVISMTTIRLFIRLTTIKILLLCLSATMVYYAFILVCMVHLMLDRMFTILFLRYEAITKALKRNISLHGKKAAALTEKMIFCYEHLSSSGERLNDFFSLQILCILTICFIISFSEVYAVILLFYDGEPLMNEIVEFIIKTSWASTGYIITWQIGHRFSAISEKAKEFNSILYRIMIEDKSNMILYNEKLMAHFTMKKEPVFTACGLFKLDYTLVHSMLASAVSYLVILIQFSHLTPSEESGTTSYTGSFFNETTFPTLFNTSYLE